ncbi:MAG: GNAT family N-acetyltransferase [Pseudobdellovibrionaceae bacterium]
MTIRKADEQDVAELNALSKRSKAHWGYSDDFIESCVPFLNLEPEELEDTFLLEEGGKILGLYSVWFADDAPELTRLFVEPAFIGKGYGKALWLHAVEHVKSKGHDRMFLVGDPHAMESFYIPMGCALINEVESEAQKGRLLPVLAYQIV